MHGRVFPVSRRVGLPRPLALITLAGGIACALLLSGLGLPARATAATPAPGLGAQWHALWADQTPETRTRELDIMAANGVQWLRIDVGWTMIEPREGQYDLAWGVPLVESVVDQARARGMKVMVQFWRTPSWANGGRGETAPPTDPADYANALGWLVGRMKGRVAAWQVWNEPNLDSYFTGADPTRYVSLLKPAYRAAHAADAAAVVVFGGTMYVDTDWIGRAYAAGAQGSFDVMAVHPYQGRSDLPPESPDTGDRTRMMHVDVLVDLMAAKGDAAKPIWFSEYGWSVHTNTSTTPVWQLGVTEAQQADYFSRTVALVQARWPQVRNLFWYNSRDKDTGSLHTDRRGLMRRDFTPREILSHVRAAASTSTTSSTTTAGALIPQGSDWRYRDSGVEDGGAWRSLAFDGSQWPSGRAVLGYGNGDEKTVLAPGHIGYAFRRSFDVADPAAVNSLTLRTVRDDGIVVWLNGVEVWCDNMPAGSVTMNTPASGCVGGSDESAWHSVTLPKSALATGRNVLAVSVHNCSSTSSDARFDLELSAG